MRTNYHWDVVCAGMNESKRPAGYYREQQLDSTESYVCRSTNALTPIFCTVLVFPFLRHRPSCVATGVQGSSNVCVPGGGRKEEGKEGTQTSHTKEQGRDKWG